MLTTKNKTGHQFASLVFQFITCDYRHNWFIVDQRNFVIATGKDLSDAIAVYSFPFCYFI